MKKALSWLLTAAICLSLLVTAAPIALAAEVTQRYIFDAEVLPGGTIGVLFIYGGTSASGIVTGGTLCFGVYDPDTGDWSQQPVAPGGGSPAAAKDAALALDGDGNPHIAYITSDDNLGYTYMDGSYWSEADIIDSIAFGDTDGALTSPDIAVDSSGYAHISYMDAKGGYTGGNNYSPYEKDDLVYAQNTSGSFEKTVRSYSHGWFYSPDGWRNLVYAPTKITLIGSDEYCIGVKQYQYDKGMSTQYHTYGYDLFFASTSLGYPIRSATTNNDLGFKLFEMDSDGSTVYSLFNRSGVLYVTGGVSEIPAAAKTFAAAAADMTVPVSGVYYAAIASTNTLLFYQDESFVEGLTATTALNTTHPRMATVVTGGDQYILYTGNDLEKSLFIASVPVGGGDLTEYQVPNKTPVTISGVTVADKVYDGEAAMPGGTLAVTGDVLTEADLDFTYSSTDGGGYSEAVPPTAAGAYQLVISVPESNADYSGTSAAIPFTISKKPVSVTGTVALGRDYAPGDLDITLDTAGSALDGVIAADTAHVTLDKSGAAGTIATADAGDGKAVSVTGFTLTGTKAGNYVLSQPEGLMVDIAPAGLAAPTAFLIADMAAGGLSVTVSDGANTLGVASYTVEVYQEGTLVKTVTGLNKNTDTNIPPETGVITPEVSYTAKAKAKADASGNYTDSALGTESAAAVAEYAPLGFADSEAYDIPASKVDAAITAIDVSGGVTGGKAPYSFAAAGLPAWAQISTAGVITGTPTGVAASGGTATVTVADALLNERSITIAYGAVLKGDALAFGGTAIPTEKIYGDTPFALELTYDGQIANVSYAVVSGPGSLEGSTLTITGAGDIVVRATGTSDNYLTKTEDFTVTVHKKAVTITPTPTSNTKVYGEADTALAYTNTELVGLDTLAGTILTRAAGENAGDYAISIAAVAAAANPNYELTLASGSHFFTITKKGLAVSGAIIASKDYDGTASIDFADVTAVTLTGDLDSLALGTDFEVTAAAYTGDAFAGAGKATSVTVALKNTAKANNYEFTGGANVYTDASANITPAAQTISASAQTLTVTHTLDLFSVTSSNAAGAVLTYAIEGGTSDYATLSGSVLTGTAPGTFTVNINSAAVDVGGSVDVDYTAAPQKQITVTVSAKANADDTITLTASSITYGDTYSPNASTTLTGGSWSYLYAGTTVGGAVYSGTTPPTLAGSYTVTATYENDTHIGTKTGSLTISRKGLTITGIAATDRTYDATAVVAISGGTLVGIVTGDTVTPVIPATGTMENANAGTGKPVTLGAVTLDGDDKDNYTLTQPWGLTVDIEPKVISFTVEAVAGLEYTGTKLTPLPTVNDGLSTLVKDTDYTLAYGENITAGADAGSITITGIGNYLGSSAEVTFDITKATYGGSAVTGIKQVISNTAVNDVTYDLSALTFPAGFTGKSFVSVTVQNDPAGLLSGASVSGDTLIFDAASKAAGTSGELHVVVESDNYVDYTAVVTVETVDKTPITVTGVTVADKTYNGSPVSPTGTPINGDGYNGTYEYRYEGTGATTYNSTTAPADAGTYRLIVGIPAADPTYTGEQIVPFTISKAALTVKPQNFSIYVGDALPTPSVAYVGLKGSDVGTAVVQLSDGTLDMEIRAADGLTALANSAVKGTYVIVFTGSPVFETAENYTVETADGTLTITSRPSGGGGGGTTAPVSPEVSSEPFEDGQRTFTEVESTLQNGVVSATVSTQTMQALLDTAEQESAASDDDRIEITVSTSSTASGLTVTLPAIDFKAVARDTDTSFAITSPFISIVLDAKATEAVSNAAATGQITVSAKYVSENELSSEAKAHVQGRPVYDLTITNGSTVISDFKGGTATISLPYTLETGEDPNAIIVWYLDDTGNLQHVRGRYDAAAKSVIFTAGHFSKYVVGYNLVTFSDVKEGAWYKNAVTYIAAQSITSGTGDGNFDPDGKLTRAQFLVMVMRAYGIEPDASPAGNFSDAGGTYFTGYLAAAKRLGITAGVGDNMFAPNREITRQEMFTLLYNVLRALEIETPGDSGKTLSDYTDGTDVADFAREATGYMIKTGLVSGFAGVIDPSGSSTRAQMAQLLYNLLQK